MSRRIRLLAWVVAFNILLVAVGTAGAELALQPTWLVSTELTLKNVGTTPMQRATIQMPLLTEATAYGFIVSEDFNVELQEIVTLECGTRKGIFLIGTLQPGQSTTVRLEYQVASGPAPEFNAQPTEIPIMPIPDADILQTALRVIEGLADYEEQFAALQSFTHRYMRYSADSPWRNGDAIQALQQGEGVCEDYAQLLVALANAVDIPSRTVYGYLYSPRSDNWIRHAWVEYLSEDGYWQSADPTFSPEPGLDESLRYLGQGYQNLSTRVRFVGGRLAGSWREEVQELTGGRE